MPGVALGTGNVPRGNSRTHPRMLARRKRWAEALDYRMQNHSFRAIAKRMKVSTTVAHTYVVRAIQEWAPVETARQVLQMDLERIGEMFSSVYPNAVGGDLPAIATCLSLIRERNRLLGNYPNERGGGGVHVNIANNGGTVDARTTGIQVTFVDAPPRPPDDPPPPIVDVTPTALPAPSGPPVHAYSSTARHPQTVPVAPASRPGRTWDHVATASQVWDRPKGWMR